VRRAVSEVFARPEFQWVERRRPLQWLRDLWYRAIDWINGLSDTHPTVFALLVTVLVIALVALLVHVGYVLWRVLQQKPAGSVASATAAAVVLDARSHRARAEDLARAGRYAEALGHRFLAVLLDLERANAVRFHASKTPAEYVGEARLDDAGRATFASLVASLYRHLFGAVPCDQLEYQSFGDTADQLTHHVVPA
jgi:hypothetical protein